MNNAKREPKKSSRSDLVIPLLVAIAITIVTLGGTAFLILGGHSKGYLKPDRVSPH